MWMPPNPTIIKGRLVFRGWLNPTRGVYCGPRRPETYARVFQATSETAREIFAAQLTVRGFHVETLGWSCIAVHVKHDRCTRKRVRCTR